MLWSDIQLHKSFTLIKACLQADVSMECTGRIKRGMAINRMLFITQAIFFFGMEIKHVSSYMDCLYKLNGIWLCITHTISLCVLCCYLSCVVYVYISFDYIPKINLLHQKYEKHLQYLYITIQCHIQNYSTYL